MRTTGVKAYVTCPTRVGRNFVIIKVSTEERIAG
jgi:hypothetical protein